MSIEARGGYRYFLTFTDDLSRYGYIYLMKHKSETFEKFKEFQSEVENDRNKKIKFLRSDRGGEYLSYEFGLHLKQCGIVSQLTPPGTATKKGTSVTFWAQGIFFCHTYDTSMMNIVTKPGIITDVVGSYFYDKTS